MEELKIYKQPLKALVCTRCGNIIHNIEVDIKVPVENIDIDLLDISVNPAEFSGICEYCSTDENDPVSYEMVPDYMAELTAALYNAGFVTECVHGGIFGLNMNDDLKLEISAENPLVTFYAEDDDEEYDNDIEETDVIEENFKTICKVINQKKFWSIGQLSEDDEMKASYIIMFDLYAYSVNCLSVLNAKYNPNVDTITPEQIDEYTEEAANIANLRIEEMRNEMISVGKQISELITLKGE